MNTAEATGLFDRERDPAPLSGLPAPSPDRVYDAASGNIAAERGPPDGSHGSAPAVPTSGEEWGGQGVGTPPRAVAATQRIGVAAQLAKFEFLPLLPIRANDEARTPSFEIIIKRAVPTDKDLLRRAAEHQQAPEVQVLLQQRWRDMLTRLRWHLSEMAPPARGSTLGDWLAGAGPSFRAAIRCASKDEAVLKIIEGAKREWERALALEQARLSTATPVASDRTAPGQPTGETPSEAKAVLAAVEQTDEYRRLLVTIRDHPIERVQRLADAIAAGRIWLAPADGGLTVEVASWVEKANLNVLAADIDGYEILSMFARGCQPLPVSSETREQYRIDTPRSDQDLRGPRGFERT